MKYIDFIKYLFKTSNIRGMVFCYPHEFESVCQYIKYYLNPNDIKETRTNCGKYGWECIFKNGCSLFVLVYDEYKLCGQRANFIMVTEEKLFTEDEKRCVIMPLLLVPSNISEMLIAQAKGIKLERAGIYPFLYAINQEKFLTF